MDFLGEWTSNYVARCAVTVFEAAGGSVGWHGSGTVGELHMRPLGDGMINFQLHDLLDGQMLFEYTMRKPQSFTVPADRFFVIRLENGSFRGFGFTDKSAAIEMKDKVIDAVQPYSIGTTPAPIEEESPVESAVKNLVISYRSVPRRSVSKRLNNTDRLAQQTGDALPSQPYDDLSSLPEKPKKRRFWKVGKAVTALTHLFVWRNNELDIGYPTDVKHVAHIGWDGPSINGPGWMDEVRPGPDYSSAPLADFGQPRGSEWIHDAVHASKWVSSYGNRSGLPPAPPKQYLEHLEVNSKSRKFKDSNLRQRTKPAARRQRQR
ncbi:hypothetical protein KC19_4G255300 [Ceratodon purpureus]|uniref:CRIB domain-containing protein n=1 Tax=Ceratodon purpureus TaxID=3225 RepID=A0A8T0IG11_CERPU|nr:hypothetical protein KC19_4G255300 [Ceratodon purpureus]